MKKRIRDPQERVAFYEEKLDRCREVLERLQAAMEDYRAIREDVEALERYYTGPDWIRDFEADEAGAFPKDMKRGVLSEDGIDAVLELYRELRIS